MADYEYIENNFVNKILKMSPEIFDKVELPHLYKCNIDLENKLFYISDGGDIIYNERSGIYEPSKNGELYINYKRNLAFLYFDGYILILKTDLFWTKFKKEALTYYKKTGDFLTAFQITLL